ncbi:MAG: hypothetical protein JXA13_08935 [Anaerolineales bacterium]|nr:hypothetical protein [Anaerolineales bacterium]
MTPTPTFYTGASEIQADGTIHKFSAFTDPGCAGGCLGPFASLGQPSFTSLGTGLGWTVSVTDDSGALLSDPRCLPIGALRSDVDTNTQTDFGYTGQRELDSGMGGLIDNRAASPKWNGGDNARFYRLIFTGSPSLK